MALDDFMERISCSLNDLARKAEGLPTIRRWIPCVIYVSEGDALGGWCEQSEIKPYWELPWKMMKNKIDCFARNWRELEQNNRITEGKEK